MTHQKATLYEVGERNCPRLQDRSTIPVCSFWSPAGGIQILSGGPLQRHQLVCHPRQKGNNHAQRYPAGKTNPW